MLFVLTYGFLIIILKRQYLVWRVYAIFVLFIVLMVDFLKITYKKANCKKLEVDWVILHFLKVPSS